MLKKFMMGGAAISMILLGGCAKKAEPKSDLESADAPRAGSAASSASDSATDIVRTPTKTAYFGDLHVHTKNSFDAFIVGTRSTADDAYRFAQGQEIDNGAGKPIQLSGPPLDFYGVTDHGEYMGVIAAMRDNKNPISKTKTAKSVFGLLAGGLEARREAFIKIGTSIVTGDEIEDIYDRDFIDSAWAENVAAAEAHNQPGKFTTFAGYEFTAMEIIGEIADNQGALNLHRNVIFADKAPTRIFTTLDSNNPEDLWQWMNEQRASGTEVLAIPHNSNGSNGQMFDTSMTDGSPITQAYAKNRILNEPIAEMSQVKGTSETHPMLSPNDEWAAHELYDILIGMPVKALIKPGSFVRQSLGRGLEFESNLGANPYKFGFIGSTDAHVSASSLSEKDFFGKFSSDLDADTRGSIPPNGKKEWEQEFVDDSLLISAPQYAAAGLAGVWAQANTRKDLFESMQAKEVFATSGPRIHVRFFAGQGFDDDILTRGDMIETAYAQGVPMGADLVLGDIAPEFLVWASRDALSVPLQRAQIIKVTAEGEQVYDVACADGSLPNINTDTGQHRCADNGARVDITTCKTSGSGASELKTIWRDPDWQAGQAASYYVRILENPKCRWSTWDAVRNGSPPNPAMQAVLQDRAWSSPIWTQ